MPFNKYGPADTPWVDVGDLKNVPFGARKIRADNFLNRVEDSLESTAAELVALPSTYATREDLALASSSGLVEDPARPGIYMLGTDTEFTEDPARPGIYTIGV